MLGRVTAGLFFLLLIWGNLVAGMHAGMACPDWPLCEGELIPPMRLDVWMEFLHRVIAALATVFLLLLARQRFARYQGKWKALPIVALGLLAAEVMLGAVVVLLELPVQPTTVHFMIALAVFLLVLFMTICDGAQQPALFSLSEYAGPLFGVTLMIFFQASLGAYLRHSGSGLACPDFPTCRGEFIPTHWDGPTIVHFSHRLLAIGTFGTIAMLYLASLLDERLKKRHKELLTLVFLVALQIGVGAATVTSGLAYQITSLHLAMTLGIIGYSLRIWLEQSAEPGGLRK